MRDKYIDSCFREESTLKINTTYILFDSLFKGVIQMICREHPQPAAALGDEYDWDDNKPNSFRIGNPGCFGQALETETALNDERHLRNGG